VLVLSCCRAVVLSCSATGSRGCATKRDFGAS
jgi:hypothetical protein